MSLWLSFSSIMLAFVFVFGNSIRNMYEVPLLSKTGLRLLRLHAFVPSIALLADLPPLTCADLSHCRP